MPSSFSTWFLKDINPTTIITLNKPSSSRQIRIQRSQKAFMRIYIQVPRKKTETDDTDTRGQQAAAFTSLELTASLTRGMPLLSLEAPPVNLLFRD
ncbi:unnamed protein product [Penicillium camemberti]|uniref:Str. FM013 n=1 Tax=Penicillium camemberti (strain FM 013) TaxID=1429867 RepID=A0A0G4P766_PENC3|nr:unnamed protein product [Penicillium camemberti]